MLRPIRECPASSIASVITMRISNLHGQKLTEYVGNGYLANVAPSEFAGIYEEELPVSISGKEWLAEHDEHWDSATQVLVPHFIWKSCCWRLRGGPDTLNNMPGGVIFTKYNQSTKLFLMHCAIKTEQHSSSFQLDKLQHGRNVSLDSCWYSTVSQLSAVWFAG